MPRVSQAHLDARRAQILDAARRVFARQGFAATSMQDVFAESGLSAGAVYRYFKSRDEIVEAIAHQVLRTVEGMLGDVVHADPPPPLDEVLVRLLRFIEANDGPDGMLRVAVQVWGQAPYVPALQEVARREYGALRRLVTDVVRRSQEAGHLDPAADPEQVGKVLFAVLPGFIVQRLLLGDVDAEEARAGFRALVGGGTRVSGPSAG